jgi:hypothetical protein
VKIIEIYDKEHPVYNIMSQVLYPEAEIVYIGRQDQLTDRAQECIRHFFVARKSSIVPRFVTVQDDLIENIIKAVSAEVSGKGLYIELRGGAEELFVAIGVLAERYNISMFKIDPDTAQARPIMGEIPEAEPRIPDLKYSELICLTGGNIGVKTDSIIVNEFVEDTISRMWAQYSGDLGAFNVSCFKLSQIVYANNISTEMYGFRTKLAQIPDLSKKDVIIINNFVEQLSTLGIIELKRNDRMVVDFTFKNRTDMELISKSGLLLELFTEISAKRSGAFSDICRGVMLDWDGELTENGMVSGTNNEVDLILVKGFKVFYASCKSGHFSKDALYELETVADKFNTGRVARILICDSCVDSLMERANDMDISVISGSSSLGSFDSMSTEFKRIARMAE